MKKYIILILFLTLFFSAKNALAYTTGTLISPIVSNITLHGALCSSQNSVPCYWADKITWGTTETINEIKIYATSYAVVAPVNDNLTFEIRDAVDGNILKTAYITPSMLTLYNSGLPDSAYIQTFSFSDITLTSGTTYYFELRRTTNDSSTSRYYIGTNNDQYTPQGAFYNISMGSWSSFTTGYGSFYFTTDYVAPSPSITHSTPADSSTSSAYIHFTGGYSNPNGTYDTIGIMIEDLTHTANPAINLVCGTATMGSGLTYSCYLNGIVNTNYHYKAYLWDSTQTFPSGTLIETNWTTFTTNDTYDIPQIGGNTCSTFDVGCYIVNGLKYLFYPNSFVSSGALNDLINSIKNKPPIGYIGGIITALGSINLNATPTLTFATFTPLNTYVFSPFRTGLVFVLWFAFAFMILKRFQHLQL